MLISKQNPTGIDVTVAFVQEQLNRELMTRWGIDDKLYKCYGRCYRNKTLDNGYIAELYDGDSEYKEVYFDDSLIVLSFFGFNIKPIDQNNNVADMHLVFFVDLDRLELKDNSGQLIKHRADEEVRRDVFRSLGNATEGMIYRNTELYLENVLREYPGSRRDNWLKVVDMHPVHCFRINFTVQYDDTDCGSPPYTDL